jgi:hypothetical protein
VCVEEVVPAFINCTRTDTKFEANVCNDCGISWEAATIRIGAHLHESRPFVGLSHQESGVMILCVECTPSMITYEIQSPSSILIQLDVTLLT